MNTLSSDSLKALQSFLFNDKAHFKLIPVFKKQSQGKVKGLKSFYKCFNENAKKFFNWI